MARWTSPSRIFSSVWRLRGFPFEGFVEHSVNPENTEICEFSCFFSSCFQNLSFLTLIISALEFLDSEIFLENQVVSNFGEDFWRSSGFLEILIFIWIPSHATCGHDCCDCGVRCYLSGEIKLYESLGRKLGWRFTARLKYYRVDGKSADGDPGRNDNFEIF